MDAIASTRVVGWSPLWTISAPTASLTLTNSPFDADCRTAGHVRAHTRIPTQRPIRMRVSSPPE
jgi:hypothetical protein